MQPPMTAASAPARLVAGLLAVLALGLAGCEREHTGTAVPPTPPGRAPADQSPPEPIALTDDAGRAIRLERPAKRVLSLAPSHTEIAFAIGAGDRLVGRTPACDHPPEAAAVPPIGNLFPPDYERIVGAAPDLVLMAGGQVEIRRRLEGQGLTVAVIQPKTLPEVAGAMRTIGRLLGVDAGPAAKRFEAALAEASRPAGAEAPKVFYEVGFDPLFGAGPASFVGDLIARAGGRNALSGDAEWPRLATEQLVAAAPDVILVGNSNRAAAVKAEPPAGWSALPAVAAGRIRAVPDPDLFVRPGPRVVDGLRWLSGALDDLPKPAEVP